MSKETISQSASSFNNSNYCLAGTNTVKELASIIDSLVGVDSIPIQMS